MKNIKITIADECTIVRRGMFSMLMHMPAVTLSPSLQYEFTFTEDAATPTALFSLLSKQMPDVLFLGYSLATYQSQNPLSGMDGLGMVKWVHHHFPHLNILVLSPFKHTLLIRKVLEAGARAYLSRNLSEQTLQQALQSVLSGEVFIERELMTCMFQQGEKAHEALSPREIDVLRMLCKGLSLNDISRYMHLSNKTVSAYKLKAMGKLGVQNDCQLYGLLVKTQMFDIAI